MSRAAELDLVQANQGLYFPPNVELNFLYWTHSVENIPSLEPHLQSADAIVDEVAHIDAGQGHVPKSAGKRLEKAMNHAVQGIATSDETRFISSYSRYVRDKVDLFKRLPRKPRLYLVDDYAGTTPEKQAFTDRALGYTLLEGEDYAKDNLEFYVDQMFEREHITLNQLSAIAIRLGKSGDEKVLAAPYGSRHTALSVAARELGANVHRRFLQDRTPDTVVDVIAKLIRYNVLPPLEDTSAEDFATFLAAISIDAALDHQRSDHYAITSAAAVLKTVSELKPSIRRELMEKAHEINNYNRKKHHGKKTVKGKPFRVVTHLPSIVRFMKQSMSLESDFLQAAEQQRKAS